MYFIEKVTAFIKQCLAMRITNQLCRTHFQGKLIELTQLIKITST